MRSFLLFGLVGGYFLFFAFFVLKNNGVLWLVGMREGEGMGMWWFWF